MIFCKDCKYYMHSEYTDHGITSDYCNSPNNKKECVDYEHQYTVYGYDIPSKLNADNNCLFYQQKSFIDKIDKLFFQKLIIIIGVFVEFVIFGMMIIL